MAKKWNELSPRSRRLILVGGAVEGALKVAALVDLARRPAGQVKGSKGLWAVVVTLANSFGVVPAVYLIWGRRRAPSTR